MQASRAFKAKWRYLCRELGAAPDPGSACRRHIAPKGLGHPPASRHVALSSPAVAYQRPPVLKVGNKQDPGCVTYPLP
jgi:hypothetical protein